MIIYETTCLINDKKYIGMDTRNNPYYFGSGLLISRALKKYGKENFVKKVIETCETKKELKEREDYWIQFYNAQESNDYYNIMPGGLGGDYLTYHPNREKIIEKFSGEKNGMSRKRKNPYMFNEEQLDKMSFPGEENPMFNKRHKESSKQIQKEKAIGRFTLEWFIERNGEKEGKRLYEERNKKLSINRQGENNPFYGKTWEYEKHPRYTHVPSDELFNLFLEQKSLKEIADYYDTTVTTIRAKVKKYWGCTVTEFRKGG